MKKNYLSLLSLIFLICLIVFSCRKDIENIVKDQVVSSPALENARIWHSQNTDKALNPLKPLWTESWTLNTSSGKVLVVPTSEMDVSSTDFSIRRVFVFSLSRNSISKGVIIEFLGKKYDVSDNLNRLIVDASKSSIPEFNGTILTYDVNYRQLNSAVFKEGIKIEARSNITMITGQTLLELKAQAVKQAGSYSKQKIASAFNFDGLANTSGSAFTCKQIREVIEYYSNGRLTDIRVIYYEVCVANPPASASGSSGSGTTSSGSSSNNTNYQNPDYGGPVIIGGGGSSGGTALTLNVIDTTGLSAYPTLKQILMNLPTLVADYPNIKAALAFYTGFTEAQISNLLKPGKGPKLKVANLPDRNGKTVLGEFDRATKTLLLNEALVNGLDAVTNPTRYKTLVFLMTITTLHEVVHYGRNVNRLNALVYVNGQNQEAGTTFEMSIQPPGVDGNGIDRNNAVEWIRHYEFKTN